MQNLVDKKSNKIRDLFKVKLYKIRSETKKIKRERERERERKGEKKKRERLQISINPNTDRGLKSNPNQPYFF